MNNKLRISVHKQEWTENAVEVLIHSDTHYCKHIELIPKEEGVCYSPTFSITTDMAQKLMDNLWDCGFRPTEGQGSAGSLSATKYHLEDMRRLVFDKIKGDKHEINR